MTAKQRRQIIARAVELLKAGTLPDALLGQLMDEFGLTRSQARDLATAALREWKADRGMAGDS